MSAPSPKRRGAGTSARPKVDSRKLSRVGREAVRLAKLGLYVGPLAPGTKNPGSRLGKGWPSKTSNNPRTVKKWFLDNPEDGLFLHLGPSRLIAFDLDIDEGLEQLPTHIADALRLGLFQRSRKGDRGHYVFGTTEIFGNGAGGFSPFGDVRGANGVIVVAPTIHPVTGRRYRLVRGDWGNVPELPSELRALLRVGGTNQKPALSPEQLKERLASLTTGSDHELLNERAEQFSSNVADGQHRHDALLRTLLRVMEDAKKGSYPAAVGVERLRQEFEACFAVPQPGRRSAPASGEFDGMLAWAAAQLSPEESALELFDSTPELRMIRRWAQERLVSPTALLMTGVALALTCVPPRYALPPVIGTAAPVNFILALAGQSGAGKGVTEDLAREVFQFPQVVSEDVHIGKPGSSEGIAKMFGQMRREGPGRKGKLIPVYTKSRVLASLPEIDTLSALMKRDGSHLSATLREVWTGSRLGYDYAHEHTKFMVGAKRYRLCLVIGVQPERAETLLREQGGGLLQRVFWARVTIDPSSFEPPTGDDADLEPIQLPEYPDEESKTSAWRKAMGGDATPDDLVLLEIPEEVRAQIITAQTLIRQGLVPDIEGHRLLVQEKIAVGLAVIHGYLGGFTREHWQMAGLLMQSNDQTLDELNRDARRKRERNRMLEAAASGKARHVRSEAEERELQNKVKQRVLDLLERREWTSRSALRKNISPRQREVVEQVMEDLLDKRQVRRTTRTGQNGQKQTFYQLVK